MIPSDGEETQDTSSYLYDATSGFYYDPETTLYYDPGSRVSMQDNTEELHQYIFFSITSMSCRLTFENLSIPSSQPQHIPSSALTDEHICRFSF